jgi:hypothetical protein
LPALVMDKLFEEKREGDRIVPCSTAQPGLVGRDDSLRAHRASQPSRSRQPTAPS